MGQAKRRGSFEERQKIAIEKNKEKMKKRREAQRKMFLEGGYPSISPVVDAVLNWSSIISQRSKRDNIELFNSAGFLNFIDKKGK